MVTLDDLPVDILHHIVQSCNNKPDLLSLRQTSQKLSSFLLPYVDKHLALEVSLGTHIHLHRAAAAAATPPDNSDGCTMLARLLKANAPVDGRDKNSETALHVASRHGDLRGVRNLLDAGADVNAVSSHGWTPLQLVCRYGFVDIARLLLDYGAGVNKPGFGGRTALDYAVLNGHEECVRVLGEYGYGVAEDDAAASEDVARYAVAEGVILKQHWGIYSFRAKP